MDKDILVQYCEMKEEIKDLRQRIMKLDKFLQDPPIVADTVTGSRKDLTIGPIKVTGIPDPIYRRKQAARERYKKTPGTQRSGAAGTYHAGRGVHRQHSEVGIADHVSVVFY